MLATSTKRCSPVQGDRAILSEFNYEGDKATEDLKWLFSCVFFPPVVFLPQWPVQLAIIGTLYDVILFQLFKLSLINPCLGFPFVFMMGSKKNISERSQLKTFKSETHTHIHKQWNIILVLASTGRNLLSSVSQSEGSPARQMENTSNPAEAAGYSFLQPAWESRLW